jgi:hypothetical protein
MPQASLGELIWLIYIGKANLAKPGEVTNNKSMEPTKQPLLHAYIATLEHVKSVQHHKQGVFFFLFIIVIHLNLS